jgi:hypothetical protein
MWNVRLGGRRDAFRVAVFDLRERDHLEDLGVVGENIKMDRKETEWGPCAGLMWFRIGTGGRVL